MKQGLSICFGAGAAVTHGTSQALRYQQHSSLVLPSRVASVRFTPRAWQSTSSRHLRLLYIYVTPFC